LIGNELVEIGIGEHFPRARLAVTDGDIAQRPQCDMAIKGAQRTIELGCRLGAGQQAVWWTRLARAVGAELALATARLGHAEKRLRPIAV
jgi:hypothetical protein